MLSTVVIAGPFVGGAAVGAAPMAVAAGSYENCTTAHQAGRYDIPKGDSDHWTDGDRDGEALPANGSLGPRW